MQPAQRELAELLQEMIHTHLWAQALA